MDTNFQTSFIPKKALTEDRIPVQRHTSIFSFIATLIFFGALAAGAGVYFYKASILKEIVSKDASLKAAQNAFEPGFISEIQILDNRITSASELLKNHIVVTPIFDALEENTLKSIQYTKFGYSTGSQVGAPLEVHLSGRARDYTSIALESDNIALNKNIHDPIFSNLTLDERTGTVTFDLVFSVDADLVHYTNHLANFVSQTAPASSEVDAEETDVKIETAPVITTPESGATDTAAAPAP